MEVWKQIRYIYRGCSARENERFLLIGVQGISLLSFITKGGVQQASLGIPWADFSLLKAE